jgi:uncharacterized protein YbjT (DUF2867 family)
MKVLVTGATGYIGGRLVPRLLERGHAVSVLVRDPVRALERPWADRVEIVGGDLCEPETLEGAFEGVEAAYYLVHSMHAGPDFDQVDLQAAAGFCASASVKHVIYLGGLLPRRDGGRRRSASKHLLSRAEIGRMLARRFPITELRAGPIIGSGSASFELLRYVTERFPVVLAPRWVRNEVTPVGIVDVLHFLSLALERGPCGVVEIGSDPISYKEMMLRYARARGLRRRVVTVPGLFSVRLGARSIGLWTPIPASLAGPLLEGMAEPLRARTGRARRFFPEVCPMGYGEALERALASIEGRAVETRWRRPRTREADIGFRDMEGLVRDTRRTMVNARPADVFRVLSGIGGENGWPAMGWLYRLHAATDRLLGGTGLRRSRPDAEGLVPGAQVDYWRVEEVSAPHVLRLHAPLRFPGRGWIQWKVESLHDHTFLTQTATFALRGLLGTTFWYAFHPFHRMFFAETLEAVAEEAAQLERSALAGKGRVTPPVAPRGVTGDVREFLLRRPPSPTLVEFDTRAEREDYSLRIMQRLGIDVTSYSVLNLHRIGVEAPVQDVFEELLQWNGHSSCWPNHIARVELTGGGIERIEIRPLGLKRIPFGAGSGVGVNVAPLFRLEAMEIQASPDGLGADNARFLLHSCSGGYPIGIFVIYVRSPVADMGETERTQVFFGVGFNFFGSERLSRSRLLQGIWAIVHNRVTANVMHRFKRVCEWRFQRAQDG